MSVAVSTLSVSASLLWSKIVYSLYCLWCLQNCPTCNRTFPPGGQHFKCGLNKNIWWKKYPYDCFVVSSLLTFSCLKLWVICFSAFFYELVSSCWSVDTSYEVYVLLCVTSINWSHIHSRAFIFHQHWKQLSLS